jgi:hypothetical protein
LLAELEGRRHLAVAVVAATQAVQSAYQAAVEKIHQDLGGILDLVGDTILVVVLRVLQMVAQDIHGESLVLHQENHRDQIHEVEVALRMVVEIDCIAVAVAGSLLVLVGRADLEEAAVELVEVADFLDQVDSVVAVEEAH